MNIHVVRKGENIGLIARQYGVVASQIVYLNELFNPNVLAIGQALLVPEPHKEYVVQPGDSLEGIAQRFRTTPQALLQSNDLMPTSYLYAGQLLLLPIVHVVQSGESLYSIAHRYGTTVQAIGQANGLHSVSGLSIGQRLVIPAKPKPEIDANAFIDRFGEDGAKIVRKESIYLTYFSPFGYRIKEDGSLEPVNDEAEIQAALANGAVPMMAVTNFSATEAGSQLAHKILSNTDLQDHLLTNIVQTMKSKGYKGLNIDFENVLPADREAYNQFLRRAVKKLHAEDYFVSSSLAPKTSAGQKGLLYEAHDYQAHGEILDFVVLMTYEWGCRVCPPQSVSPINQIRAVLNYATSVIPRNRILMGFQLYARDWLIPHIHGQQAETVSMQEAVRRATQYGADIQYDTKSQTPFFRYTDEHGRHHEVWFEDARSALVKFNTIKQYDLLGVSYWVLGYPFPQNWALLHEQFKIRKL